jgi:hypothetical protein
MSATAQLSKLAELRTKTDQDLVRILYNALEVGLLPAANEPDLRSVRGLAVYTSPSPMAMRSNRKRSWSLTQRPFDKPPTVSVWPQ